MWKQQDANKTTMRKYTHYTLWQLLDSQNYEHMAPHLIQGQGWGVELQPTINCAKCG